MARSAVSLFGVGLLAACAPAAAPSLSLDGGATAYRGAHAPDAAASVGGLTMDGGDVPAANAADASSPQLARKRHRGVWPWPQPQPVPPQPPKMDDLSVLAREGCWQHDGELEMRCCPVRETHRIFTACRFLTLGLDENGNVVSAVASGGDTPQFSACVEREALQWKALPVQKAPATYRVPFYFRCGGVSIE